jgi:hypothetical protein
VDEQVDGADASAYDGGTADTAPQPRVVDPHADTGPIPVVTAEEAAAALAAHHSHVREHHAHEMHGHPHIAPPVHHEPPRHAENHRRRTALVAGGVAAALLVVGGVSAYALTRGDDPATPLAGPTGSGQGIGPGPDGSTPTVSGISPTASTPPLAASMPTLVLGDSLGLTVYPWLADLLPDRYVSYEAVVGRSTASAADALEAMAKIPKVVIVSSGTNDQGPAEVRAAATRILDRLGPRRCVVWVDVVRPERVGAPQEEINAAIDKVVAGRSNVRVLRWSEMVAEHPEWLSSDGIHPNQEGAKARAEAFAQAAQACSPLDPDAPRAERQVLPSSVFSGPVSSSGSSGSTGSSGSSGSSRTPTASSSPTKKPKPTRTATPDPTTSSPKPSSPAPTPTPTPTKTQDPPADPPNPP